MEKKQITAILIAENGFSRRIKIQEENGRVPLTINQRFLYKVRVTSPVMGDYIDLDTSPVGEFKLQKRTKTTATYRLYNLYQAKEVLT